MLRMHGIIINGSPGFVVFARFRRRRESKAEVPRTRPPLDRSRDVWRTQATVNR